MHYPHPSWSNNCKCCYFWSVNTLTTYIGKNLQKINIGFAKIILYKKTNIGFDSRQFIVCSVVLKLKYIISYKIYWF